MPLLRKVWESNSLKTLRIPWRFIFKTRRDFNQINRASGIVWASRFFRLRWIHATSSPLLACLSTNKSIAKLNNCFRAKGQNTTKATLHFTEMFDAGPLLLVNKNSFWLTFQSIFDSNLFCCTSEAASTVRRIKKKQTKIREEKQLEAVNQMVDVDG